MMPSDFIYTANFPGLNSGQIQGGIDAVETTWYGALQYWATLGEPIRTKKRVLLENLLVAWYLADMFPQQVVGIIANGGLPLSSKSIGGTSVAFKDIETQQGMESLTSNTFGVKALQMMESAPERFAVYG